MSPASLLCHIADNDDGSSYYISRNNFFIYGDGGLKDDFEGHDNHVSSSIRMSGQRC